MKTATTCIFCALSIFLLLSGCGEGDKIETYVESEPAPAVTSDSPMPAGHPPLGGDYVWQAPEGWETKPPSSMRIGSYLVPHGSDKGDLSVIRLAGEAGGQLNNLNRWRGQIGLAPVAPGTPEAEGRQVDTPVGSFTVWTLVNGAPVDQGMLVAMLFTGDHSLFVKLTGPPQLVEAVDDQFTKFLKSINRSEEG